MSTAATSTETRQPTTRAVGSAERAVLFDVEGVIAHTDLAAAERRLAEVAPGLTVARLEAARHQPEVYARWTAHSTGRLDADSYWADVVEALELPPEPARVRALRSVVQATWWARLDAGVLDIVRRLRAAAPEGELRLGVLSNSAPDYETYVGAFTPAFDAVHFSHRTGRRKPQPAAFIEAARALDVAPEAVVFIDDKPRNTSAAVEQGLTAVDFRDAGRLAERLASLGLL